MSWSEPPPICITHGAYLHNYAPIEVEGVRFFDNKEWECRRCGKIITRDEWLERERTIYKSPTLGGKYSGR